MDTITGNSFYFDFEVKLMEYLQTALGDKAISIISFFSAFGEEMLLIAILGYIYWCYDKKFGIYTGTNMVIGIVLNPLVKNIFWRRRPYFDNEAIKCLRPVDSSADIYDIKAQGFSFPSGHSTNSITAYGSISRYKKNNVVRILAFVFPLLVGFSRIVVGVHYPTDVLCGWLLGIVVIFLTPMIIDKFGPQKRWLAFLIIFLVGCLGFFYCKTTDYFSGLGIMGGFFVSVEYEERFVHFESTRNPVFSITRVLGGYALYIALNQVLKLPFNADFLASGTLLSDFVRFLRYFIVAFVCIGLYPHVFKIEKRFKQ